MAKGEESEAAANGEASADQPEAAADPPEVAPTADEPSVEDGDAALAKMIADAKAKLPVVHARLQERGMEGSHLDYTVVRLAATEIEEELLLRALFDDGPREEDGKALVRVESKNSARRQLTVIKHSLVRWHRRKGLLGRVFYLFGWLAALLGPSIKAGFTWIGALGVAAVVMIRLRNAWKDFDPDTIPILEQNHEKRQLQLEGLIHSMQQWIRTAPNKREIAAFRGEVLRLITSYVRDHRSDVNQRKIFANLLVQQGSVAVVIARSDFKRRVPVMYKPEECSVAWRSFLSGNPEFTGDVYLENPQTPPNKRYSSVLVLPIKLEHRVLGVVSIDSEEKSHFDNVHETLHNELAPYVQLLAITLIEDHDADNSNQRVRDGGNPGHS